MKDILKSIIGIGMSIIATTSSLLCTKDINNEEWLHTVSSYEYVENVGSKLINYIVGNDRDAISSLFCDKVKDTDYLNQSLSKFFKYIDDNGGILIEENAQWTVPAEHKTYSDRGTGKVVHFTSSKYWGKVVINNEDYELGFDSYLVNKNNKLYERITEIYLDKKNIVDISLSTATVTNNNTKNEGLSLGMGIYILNLDKLCWENVILPDVENLSDYHYSFDELEKGASSW